MEQSSFSTVLVASLAILALVVVTSSIAANRGSTSKYDMDAEAAAEASLSKAFSRQAQEFILESQQSLDPSDAQGFAQASKINADLAIRYAQDAWNLVQQVGPASTSLKIVEEAMTEAQIAFNGAVSALLATGSPANWTDLGPFNSLVLNVPPYDSPTTVGTKRAFLIGCNYNFPGSACIQQGCVLRGCIQDVVQVRSALVSQCGFVESNIQTLRDDVQVTSPVFPTKQAIVSGLTNVLTNATAGDFVFIWFSGHGVRVPNPSAVGGYNECWVPADTLLAGNYLTDQELNRIVKLAAAGVVVFVGSDSCHSGTVFDLKYILGQNGVQTNKTMAKLRGREGPIPATSLVASLPFVPNIPARSIFSSHVFHTLKGAVIPLQVIQDENYIATSAAVIALSGCSDPQTSADTVEDGINQGAMTWAFLSTLRYVLNRNGYVSDLLTGMRDLLSANSYPQVPQMELGLLFDPNTTRLSQFLMIS